MTDQRFDVVILGGGIHGAGVAQATAAAGHSVLLLEKSELAAGTSSRSSKLIHGGLRYLESLQFSLVRESLKERKLLLKNASSFVKLVPFYIPIYRNTRRRRWKIHIGLGLYALLGGFTSDMFFRTLGRAEWDQFPGLKTDGLQDIFQYLDGQTDDAALTRAVVESAKSMGAEVRYPAEFQSGEIREGGYAIHYEERDTQQSCLASVVVNAAGPWINIVREKFDPQPPSIKVDLVQGAHILFDQPISSGIIYAEAPTDGRAVFFMPWQGKTLVGTTETTFAGSPDEAVALPEEVNYLSETLNHYFPEYSGNVVGKFAGLRVLPRSDGSLFRRSRETTLISDNTTSPKYIAIYGGKLTGYRATAEKVMSLIRRTLPAKQPVATTDQIKLDSLRTEE